MAEGAEAASNGPDAAEVANGRGSAEGVVERVNGSTGEEVHAGGSKGHEAGLEQAKGGVSGQGSSATRASLEIKTDGLTVFDDDVDSRAPASPPLAGGFIRDDEDPELKSAFSSSPQSTTPSKPPPNSSSSPATPPGSGSPGSDPSSSSLGLHSPSELRRVKVYELKGDSWLDRGTGYCEGIFEPAPPTAGALGLSGMGVGSSPFLGTGPPSPGGSRFDEADFYRGRKGRIVLGGGEARIEVRKEETETTAGGELLLRSRVMHPSQSVVRRMRASVLEDNEEDTLDAEGKPGKRLAPTSPKDDRRKRVIFDWPEGGAIYQRQQDTLIVWTELDGVDMALSFATPQGCQEMWRFLVEAQEMLGPSPDSRDRGLGLGGGVFGGSKKAGSRGDSIWDDDDDRRRSEDDDGMAIELLSTSSPSSSPGFGQQGVSGSIGPPLPTSPTLANIAEADVALKLASRTAQGREKASAALLRTGFIKKMDGVFKDAEDVESEADLHALCILMQTILTLNDATLYEYCVQDDVVLGVASILEYDPEFGDHKASYRAHLADTTRFREVVPIRDANLRGRIHQTYRLQYFKDVILARILDDPTFSILNTMIFFNQIDIVTHLQGNEAFLRELFGVFDEAPAEPVIGPSLPGMAASVNEAAEQRKDDAILFLQELCAMAKHLQIAARTGFYRSLCEHGLLMVLEHTLARQELDPAIRSATCEVLVTVIDHDPNSVRTHCLKQHSGKKRSLVTFLIELLIAEQDVGLKVQLVEALRILVDAGGEGVRLEAGGIQRKEEDPEAEKFLQFFYDNCVQDLVKPISDLPDHHRQFHFTNVEVALFNHLCDLLSFFVTHHTFRSKYFILSSTVSAKVATLLQTRFKHLRLAALRYFRACINKNDDFYNRYLFKNDLFTPLIDLTFREGRKDNLLASACLEFFEHLRLTNAKPVLNHLMDVNGARVRQLAEKIPVFQALVQRWEQTNEPPPPPGADMKSEELKRTQTINIGSWSRAGNLDSEEDKYFNDSDDDDDPPPVAGPSRVNGRDEHETQRRSPASKGDATHSPLFGLLDYGDDSDEETPVHVEEALPDRSAPPASPSITTSDLPFESSPAKERSAAPPPLTRTTSLTSLSGAAPPVMKIGERRRREEEADDQMGLLGARMKRERTEHGSVTTSPVVRVNGSTRKGSPGQSATTPPIGKIKLNLSGSSTASKIASENPTDESKTVDAKQPPPAGGTGSA